jgi:hypothetical protein
MPEEGDWSGQRGKWGGAWRKRAERLLELSEKPQERGRDYAIRTARNAAEAVERKRPSG